MAETAALHQMAQKLRRHSLVSTSEAGSGHPTTCMSAADIMSVLFFDELRFDPKNPKARNVDEFVMSKGHAAPILWAALKEAGAIKEDLNTLRRIDSPLEGHPTPNSPWVRIATGSLGQGLSAAVGIAIAKRLDKLGSRVYCLLGDGECAEGSVWEAAFLAGHMKLDNLVAIVDVNRLGQSGPTMLQHDIESYLRKFAAFEWNAIGIDGHDIDEIRAALAKARATQGKPTAIVAKTHKGKGVSFLEAKDNWHGKPVKKGDDLDKALAEVGDPKVSLPVKGTSAGGPAAANGQSFRLDDPALAPQYAEGSEAATREAYGTALVKLGKVCPAVVVLDAEVKNSTFAEKFKAAFPDRFVDCYIAEQNMAGVALGMASEGKIPFASTFACFLSRAFDQIRMAGISKPEHLVFAGSHVGVSIGEDGASQMGLEDIAMFRAVAGSTVLYPSDGVSAERLTCLAAATKGIVYVRTSRPKTKTLYTAKDEFKVGGSKVLRQSDKDVATVIGAGITVHEALKAYDILKKDGLAIRVIDLYSVKPLDEATLKAAAAATKRLITVEDHYQAGGIGEAVAALGLAPKMLCVREVPRSGKPEELVEWAGISAAAIVKAVKG
ncbi:MAG TPA: transketolase [Planctomycetota bacterium]|nr:transketolase [Planctomycetota bacterium]